ncbi:MAG: NAD(P)H-hydrate dehydratase [Phycisphaerae bacterium]
MPNDGRVEQVRNLPRLPTRAAGAHKGTSGRVAIIAGSRGMSGAAILAGLGALRAGAGLVRLFVPQTIYQIVACAEPSLMVTPLAETKRGRIQSASFAAEVWPEVLEFADVVALGPGMGRCKGTARVVRCIADLKTARHIPVVLDADALTSAPADVYHAILARRETAATIVTPHPGEMKTIREVAELPGRDEQDEQTRILSALEYAADTGAVTLLKGRHTVVATANQFFVNPTGNPGQATGGMGDVLTGVIAALVAQRVPAFEAACLGAYVHGLAADQLADHCAPIGFLAREVANQIPFALSTRYGDPFVGI